MITDKSLQQQNPTVYLPFTKMQGVGNDFVVVDGRGRSELDWSALAIALCDRNKGVGADGLLVLETTPDADFLMRMHNPDGTPDVCGNGLRCLVRYAVEYGIVPSDTMRVLTLAGIRAAQVQRDASGSIMAVTVDMGEPHFGPADIPMNVVHSPVVDYVLELPGGQHLPVTALSTGSTHSVAFVEALPEDKLFFTVSPQVENHALFPARTSLMWCVHEGNARLRLRIWERGAGETWGCGTGACAAGVAAVLHGYAMPGEPITVVSKGGELIVSWQPGQTIQMTGPAENVFIGQYPLASGSVADSPLL